jgi:DNA-binding IscR family transcriptional regulator
MKGDIERFARVPLWAGKLQLRPQAWQVLVVIAAHADRAGWAHPSLATIAELTGITRNNLPRLLDMLEAAGLLRRDRGTGGRGHRP